MDLPEIDDLLEEKPITALTETPVTAAAKEDPPIDEAISAIDAAKKMEGAKIDLDPVKITEAPEVAQEVAMVAERTFPNPAPISLMLAISVEEKKGSDLKKMAQDADVFIEKTDEMLKLTKELSQLPNEEKVDFSEPIQALLAKIKQQGTDLWKEGDFKSIAKEKVQELKMLISSQIDKLRTQEQIILTKMQNCTQDLMAILESAKGFVREDAKLKSTFTRNQRVGA